MLVTQDPFRTFVRPRSLQRGGFTARVTLEVEKCIQSAPRSESDVDGIKKSNNLARWVAGNVIGQDVLFALNFVERPYAYFLRPPLVTVRIYLFLNRDFPEFVVV